MFPSIWKKGNILPIHKKGLKSEPSNYRPVCLMSNLGKLLELIILRKVDLHIEHALPSNMHGFRRNKGTESALVSFLDNIKDLKGKKKMVAVLALDCSSAFDLLDPDLVLKSLAAIGAGPKMINWVSSFFLGCEYSVKTNGSVSSSWSSNIGAGQGRRLSPVLFNIGSISMALWSKLIIEVIFADDNCAIIDGDSKEEVNRNIKLAVESRTKWYKSAGFVINSKKSEIIGFGFVPDLIVVEDTEVHPVSEIKFLGLVIRSDLTWGSQVKKLCQKLRLAANRIRIDGSLFSIQDRKKLFNAWLLGYLFCNGLAYLPFINEGQKKDIQVALNSGIRAVFSLPRYGKQPMTDLRSKLRIPSISEIIDYIILKAAWANKDVFLKEEHIGPMTRNRARLNLPLQSSSGWNGKMVKNILVKGWN